MCILNLTQVPVPEEVTAPAEAALTSSLAQPGAHVIQQRHQCACVPPLDTSSYTTQPLAAATRRVNASFSSRVSRTVTLTTTVRAVPSVGADLAFDQRGCYLFRKRTGDAGTSAWRRHAML